MCCEYETEVIGIDRFSVTKGQNLPFPSKDCVSYIGNSRSPFMTDETYCNGP